MVINNNTTNPYIIYPVFPAWSKDPDTQSEFQNFLLHNSTSLLKKKSSLLFVLSFFSFVNWNPLTVVLMKCDLPPQSYDPLFTSQQQVSFYSARNKQGVWGRGDKVAKLEKRILVMIHSLNKKGILCLRERFCTF